MKLPKYDFNYDIVEYVSVVLVGQNGFDGLTSYKSLIGDSLIASRYQRDLGSAEV